MTTATTSTTATTPEKSSSKKKPKKKKNQQQPEAMDISLSLKRKMDSGDSITEGENNINNAPTTDRRPMEKNHNNQLNLSDQLNSPPPTTRKCPNPTH